MTGSFGVAWLILWSVIGFMYLPKVPRRRTKMAWPNPLERRFWALVFSYALPAISPGPILTIIPLYLSQTVARGGLGLSQADLNGVLWMPPLGWGLGYFFWGWIADRFAAENRRPIGLFLLLTAASLTFGLTPRIHSVQEAMLLISFSAFIGGGFQMVALKVGSYSFPREQSAMMTGVASGSWSLVNFVLLRWFLGPLFNQQRYPEAFWLIALLPLAGILMWLLLSRSQETSEVIR